MALTPSTTHGGHPASRTGGDDDGLLGALHPVDLLFEFGDPLLAFRRREAPALQWVELRLCDDFNLEMVLKDAGGADIAVLEYALVFRSEGFDLDRLRAAWDRWRGSSPVAS